jgi:hypothetical protein
LIAKRNSGIADHQQRAVDVNVANDLFRRCRLANWSRLDCFCGGFINISTAVEAVHRAIRVLGFTVFADHL